MNGKDRNRKAKDLANERHLDAVVKVTINSKHATKLRDLFRKMVDNTGYKRSELGTIVLDPGTIEILGHHTNFEETSGTFTNSGERHSKGDFILYLGVRSQSKTTRNDVLKQLSKIFDDEGFRKSIEGRLSTPIKKHDRTETSGYMIMAGRSNDMRVKLLP